MNTKIFNTSDLFSGFFVSMLALPLCLGIAIASGFPPIAGLFTAITGGIVCSLIGGAPMAIKGPAAGLIVVVLGAVQELQTPGDPLSGYRRALAVGVVAGIIQIILSRLRFGKLVEMIPHSIIHGMLAAIGIIIISKQSHLLFGANPPAGLSNLSLIALIPDSIARLNPEIFAVGIFSLVIMFFSPALNKLKFFQLIPVPLVIVASAICLSFYLDLSRSHDYQLVGHIYHLGKEHLISLPNSILSSITYPDWSQIMSGTSLKYIAMFSLVGSVESLLTVSATETLKPEAQKPDHDRDLLGTGIANSIVALVGGLPMISEVARSKANIDAGAVSIKSNLFHSIFLASYLLLIPQLLKYIPLATLAGMLIYVGMRLASINEFKHAWKIGPEQFLFFITTCILTITTDLLIGVFAGLLLAVAVTILSSKSLKNLFNIKTRTIEDNSSYTVKVTGSATFLNSHQIKPLIKTASLKSKDLIVDFSEAKFVEHTFIKKLNHNRHANKAMKIKMVGLELLRPFSGDPECSRKSA